MIRLTFLLLLTVPAWSGLVRADQEAQEADGAVARANSSPAPRVSSPVASAGSIGGSKAPVLGVISSYARAIETRDVGLFRSAVSSLGSDTEARLRRAFRSIGSQRVHMNVESVDVDGTTAIVRVLREDIVDGHRMQPMKQSFRLVHGDDGWRIHSMSFQR